MRLELISKRDIMSKDDTYRFVLFSATWCAPCRMLKNMFEGNVCDGDLPLKVYEIDVDPEFARDLGVTAVPAMLALRNGQVIDRLIGVHPLAKIRQFYFDTRNVVPEAEEPEAEVPEAEVPE